MEPGVFATTVCGAELKLVRREPGSLEKTIRTSPHGQKRRTREKKPGKGSRGEAVATNVLILTEFGFRAREWRNTGAADSRARAGRSYSNAAIARPRVPSGSFCALSRRRRFEAPYPLHAADLLDTRHNPMQPGGRGAQRVVSVTFGGRPAAEDVGLVASHIIPACAPSTRISEREP